MMDFAGAPEGVDTASEWTEWFDARFPNGILVTVANGEYEDAYRDDSYQFLATHAHVDYAEDGNLTFVVGDMLSGRPLFVNVREFVEDSPFVPEDLVVIGGIDQPRAYILSSRVSVEQAEMVSRRRKGLLF